MDRVLSFLNGSIMSVHGAAYVLAAASLLSQLLALFRDRLLASEFGAGPALDVYYAAFRLQDFVFLTVASLASLSVLLPLIVEKEGLGREALKDFLSRVATVFFIFISLASLLAFILSPFLVPLLFGGLLGKGFDSEFLFLTKMLLLSPILLGLSSILGAIVQAKHRFYIYAASPLLYNLGIILGIIFLAPSYGITGVGWGVLFGALLHLLVQAPFLLKERLLPLPTWRLEAFEIISLIKVSLPRTLALSANHLALIFLTSLAALGSAGSVAVLALAMNLQSAPLAVIGASYSLAAFPTLSRHFRDGDLETFVTKTATALRHIFFWSLPAIFMLVVLRAHIVRVILGSGEFTWTDTRLTAACLALFSVSILFQSAVLLLTRAYYAAGKTKTPLFAAVFGATATIFLAFFGQGLFYGHPLFKDFLEALLRVEDLAGTEVMMLPLSYTFGSALSAGILLLRFYRDFKVDAGLWSSFGRAFCASVIAGFLTYQLLQILGSWFPNETLLGLLAQGVLSGVGGLLSGFFVLSVLRARELAEILESLKNRAWRTGVVQAE